MMFQMSRTFPGQMPKQERRDTLFIERFEHAIEILHGVERDHLPFDMAEWFADYYTNPFDCNTAACAVGWMIRDEWMEVEGLSLLAGHPYFQGSVDFLAVGKFFGIPEAEAAWLFSPGRYPPENGITPGMVIARMEKLLAWERAALAVAA